MNRLGLTGALTVIIIALSGCTGIIQSQSTAESEISTGPTIEPVESTAPLSPPPPVEVTGLNQQRAATSYANARFSYLPGQTAFNQALAGIIHEQLDLAAESRGVEYSPEAHPTSWQLGDRGCIPGSTARTAEEILADPKLAPHDGPGLSIACDSVLAAGPTYAQRLRVVSGSPTDVRIDAAETLYTNIETGETAVSGDIIAPETYPKLIDEALGIAGTGFSLPQSGDSQSGATPVDPDSLFRHSITNAGFAPDGSFVFTIGSQFLAALVTSPEVPAKEITLKIPRSRVEEFLTPLGQSISAALKDKTPWVGTPTVPVGSDFTDCSLTPCVALTFDDGPGPRTPEVLTALADRQSAATFFLLGQSVVSFPEIVKQTAESGNQVANHSWNHPALTSLNPAGVQEQVGSTNQAIADASGVTPTLMRPPYGDYNQSTLDLAGMPFILWSVDTNDWQKPGVDELIRRAVEPAVPRDIILVHDIHDDTIAATPGIIDGLRARGFSLVTVGQLLGEDTQAGNVYYGGIYD